MQQTTRSGTQGSAIDPDTVYMGCGLDSSPETMVICDCCKQRFHTACFGLQAVPDVAPGNTHAAGCCISWQWGSRSSQSPPMIFTLGLHELSLITHKACTWPQYPASGLCNRTPMAAAGRCSPCSCSPPWHHRLVPCVSTAKHDHLPP
jgi:hypothetical protein